MMKKYYIVFILFTAFFIQVSTFANKTHGLCFETITRECISPSYKYLRLNSNSPYEHASEKGLVGSMVEKPTDFSKEGYILGGWYYDELFTQKVAFPFTMPDKDITLYADWVYDSGGSKEQAMVYSASQGLISLSLENEKDHEDYIKVSLIENVDYFVATTGKTNVEVTVYDPFGEQVRSKQNNFVLETFTPMHTGDYYFEISSESTYGEYNFIVIEKDHLEYTYVPTQVDYDFRSLWTHTHTNPNTYSAETVTSTITWEAYLKTDVTHINELNAVFTKLSVIPSLISETGINQETTMTWTIEPNTTEKLTLGYHFVNTQGTIYYQDMNGHSIFSKEVEVEFNYE